MSSALPARGNRGLLIAAALGAVLCFVLLSAIAWVASADPPPRARFEVVGAKGLLIFAWIEPQFASDEKEIKAVIRAIQSRANSAAARRQTIILWSDRSLVPDGSPAEDGLPMTDAQAESQVAHFSFRGAAGEPRLLIDGRQVDW